VSSDKMKTYTLDPTFDAFYVAYYAITNARRKGIEVYPLPRHEEMIINHIPAMWATGEITTGSLKGHYLFFDDNTAQFTIVDDYRPTKWYL